MSYQSRKTQAIIDLSAVTRNFQYIDSLSPASKTIAIVKANAYGHGAIEVSKQLDNIAPMLAVGFIDEAVQLREAGIKSAILVLEGALQAEDFNIAAKHNFLLMLNNSTQINWLTNAKEIYNNPLWLKVDTGMCRLGFMPDELPSIMQAMPKSLKQNMVLCSHFSSADEINNSKTTTQINRLNALCTKFKCQLSLANSAGILSWQKSHGAYNRLGLALYGASPLTTNKKALPLTPVMTLQSTVIAIRKLKIGDKVGYGEIWQAQRPTLLATVSIGYADGYPRNAKNGTPIWINGQIVPLAGRVSMDMITVDVTDLPHINIGDVVELWGQNLAVEKVAEHTDTINYELLTRVSTRVPRIYK